MRVAWSVHIGLGQVRVRVLGVELNVPLIPILNTDIILLTPQERTVTRHGGLLPTDRDSVIWYRR